MKKVIVITLLLALSLYASTKPLEKVSLQLMWLDQFQFAGYYMAKEKGFYKEVGLELEIKKFKHTIDVSEEVLSGKTTFGIGRSGLIKLRSDSKKIVLLSAILQSSPLVLLSLKSSHINNVKDFVGKKLMLPKDVTKSASIRAMILSNGVNENDMTFKYHTFDFQGFLDRSLFCI